MGTSNAASAREHVFKPPISKYNVEEGGLFVETDQKLEQSVFWVSLPWQYSVQLELLSALLCNKQIQTTTVSRNTGIQTKNPLSQAQVSSRSLQNRWPWQHVPREAGSVASLRYRSQVPYPVRQGQYENDLVQNSNL
jgi:hypothetical protein